MKEVSFECGCYYKRAGRVLFIKAHGKTHPTIFHVLAQLPITERLIARLHLKTTRTAFKLIDIFSNTLRATHLAHEYKGTLDDNEKPY